LFYTTISKTGKDIFMHLSCGQVVSDCEKEVICSEAVCDTTRCPTHDVLHIHDPSPCEKCVSIKSRLKPCDVLSKNLARMRVLASKIHRDSINDITKDEGLSVREKKIMHDICRDTFYELLPLEEEDEQISMPLLKWLAKEEDPLIAIKEIFQKYFSVCHSVDATRRYPPDIETRSFEEECCANDVIKAPKISLTCEDLASLECKKTFIPSQYYRSAGEISIVQY